MLHKAEVNNFKSIKNPSKLQILELEDLKTIFGILNISYRFREMKVSSYWDRTK